VWRRVRDPAVGTLAAGLSVWVSANPAQFGNMTSHATGGASVVGLLAVGPSVWVRAYPAQFGNLTSHAAGGVSDVGGMGACKLCTVWEPDFSCGRWCLGSLAPSSWILCVGNPAQFGNLTSRATGGVSEVGLLAVGPSVWVRTNYESYTVREPDFSCSRCCLGS